MTRPDPVTAGLVLLGIAGFAGSTGHVVALATDHGQGGWYAWTIAGAVELLAVLSGVEIRRQTRAGRRALPPKLVLAAATSFVIAANLARAEPSGWGRVLAVAPAVVFLLAAALLESRPERRTRVAAARQVRPSRHAPAGAPAPASTVPASGPHAGTVEVPSRPVTPDPADRAVVLADLVEQAQAAGPGWRPDYAELLATTGRSRRWCEARVSEARQAATAAA